MMTGVADTNLWAAVLRALFWIVLIVAGAWAASRAAYAVARQHLSEHFAHLLRKFLLWVGVLVALVTALIEVGFDPTGVLATAGIATVAIGFAAQASLSNLISGLFLIGEKPYQVGDLIRVGEHLGVVESIGLLSVSLRTLDNLLVRIPNEKMIQEPLTNVTRFPIRRMDVKFRVSYTADLGKLDGVLKGMAEAINGVLAEPEPLILLNGLGDTGVEVLYGVWFEKTRYVAVRHELMRRLVEGLDEAGIEIPVPLIRVDNEDALRDNTEGRREVRLQEKKRR